MVQYRLVRVLKLVTIGKDVLFASNVSLIANAHEYKDTLVPIKNQEEIPKEISIGAGSWIGIGAIILGETHIGKNCVVGAGSVVKGVFPDYCVIVGNPGKIMKRY